MKFYLEFEKVVDNHITIRNKETKEFVGDLYLEKGKWWFIPLQDNDDFWDFIRWDLNCLKQLTEYMSNQ